MRNRIENCIKKFCKSLNFYANSALLVWYFFCLIVAYYDKTLGINLKVCAEIINLMSISLILRVIFLALKNPKVMDFSTCFILLCWFFYYTPKDAFNSGYPIFLHIFYVSVDLFTILFLIDTFFGFLLETKFFKTSGEKIDRIYKCVLAFLCAFALFIYIKV